MGKEPYKADVIVKDEYISAIGNFSGKNYSKIINGNGAYLAPGFIDVNSDSDHYLTLFTNPEQQDFLRQGITTIIGGNCGSSLAPLIKGDLRSIRKWADTNSVNVGWSSMSEFLAILKKRRLGVNFGTLAGHSTIRRAIVGDDIRDLTDKEMAIFKLVLGQALREGAFGLSSGLGYIHSRLTPYYELRELLSVVKEYDGIYTTHLRNETEKIVDSVAETLDIAAQTGVKTIISHFRPLNGFEKEFARALLLIEERAKNLNVFFDIYPSDRSMMTIHRLLPEWFQSGGFEVMARNIFKPDIRERLIKELSGLNGGDITIIYSQGNEYLVGKTLNEFASNREIGIGEALIELINLTGFRTIILYKNINLELLNKALSSRHALIASNSASFAKTAKFAKSERSLGIFTKFISMAEKDKIIKIEDAVKKITSVPASIFELEKRGKIAEGNIADLVIFKDGEIKHTIVNGQESFTAGNILRHAR